MTEDPDLTRSKQSARQERGLIGRAYRQAKRMGKYDEALKYKREGDAMGLGIGRLVNDEELDEAGQSMYERNLKLGRTPTPGGLDGFDFRQRKDRFAPEVAPDADPGMDRPRFGYSGTESPDATPGASAAPAAAPSAMPFGRGLDRRSWSRSWNAAPTQAAKDEIVERAHGLGVEMNMDAARPSLERRRKDRLLPEPVNPGSAPAFVGPVDPDAPAGPNYLPQTAKWENPGLLPDAVDKRTGELRRQYTPALALGKRLQERKTLMGQFASGADRLAIKMDSVMRKARLESDSLERQRQDAVSVEDEKRSKEAEARFQKFDEMSQRHKMDIGSHQQSMEEDIASGSDDERTLLGEKLGQPGGITRSLLQSSRTRFGEQQPKFAAGDPRKIAADKARESRVEEEVDAKLSGNMNGGFLYKWLRDKDRLNKLKR